MRSANQPYTMYGRAYKPMIARAAFRQHGRASWYGRPFHGRRTATGEVYDMYRLTAAHPTLPLPSYARVTDVDSGRSVIVRVNDRGPFHGERVIDLSYAAAVRLGFAQQGTSAVVVELIMVGDGDFAPGDTRLADRSGPSTRHARVRSHAEPPARNTPRWETVGTFANLPSARAARLRALVDLGADPQALQFAFDGEYWHLQRGPLPAAAELARIPEEATPSVPVTTAARAD